MQLLTKPLSTVTMPPATVEVPQQARKAREDEVEEEKEEQERLSALKQREKLLRDLGVVDQIYQLLQDRTTGGGDPPHAKGSHPHHRSKQAQQRQQQSKVGHKYAAVCECA